MDTGPLVALLHPRDKGHEQCRDFLAEYRGVLIATEPVLTVATHLLARVPGGPSACLDWFLRGAATLVPLTMESLARCRRLMDQYRDVPMDFADATLVTLAEETGIRDVFTLDRRGFRAYRTVSREAFRLWP